LSVLLKGLFMRPWSVVPTVRMPGESARGPLAPLTPGQAALAGGMRADIEHLAGEIGERNTRRPAQLHATEDWLRERLRALGVGPVVDQPYPADGVMVRNLWLDIRGSQHPAEVVLLGAHFDAFPGSPAANDNGSGVAAVLAIAEALAKLPDDRRPARTVRIALFTNEEPPYFWTELMGSRVMAKSFEGRPERIVAMLTPETIGCYFDEPSTQSYPPPLGRFYPSTGNFIAFIGLAGTRGSGALIKRVVGEFRRAAGPSGVPSIGAAMPAWVPGAGSSDHSSFHRIGVPSLMITDTAPFRYPHYHTSQDTPDKIDYARSARVVDALTDVVDVVARDERRSNASTPGIAGADNDARRRR
jgi:hypothetical protein